MARINIPLEALTSRLNLEGIKSQSVMSRFHNLKPISEFLQISRLSKPRDFSDMQNRVNYNLSYFSSNYAVVFVMLSIYSLLTNLLLLFVIVLVVGGMFGISKLQGRDLDVGFARATSSQLYTGLLIIAVPLGIWASPITTVLWLIGASGALRGGVRRRYPPDWELRNARFEELESDDDDSSGHGVILDPNSYAARDRDARARGDFVSDELYFDGYDIGQDRNQRRGMYDQYGEEFDSDEMEYRDQRSMAYQSHVREKEEALIQSALERIARARAKGKTNVNLSEEEMEALERRRSQQPEPTPPPLASPPATPAKTAKTIKASSRSNSSSNLASQKTRKRASSSLFGTSTPSPAKSNSKAKVNRKPSAEHALPYPPGQAPPGMMVTGPGGVPMYAQIGPYGGPPSPEITRSPRGSRPGSRSASKHRRRESTPPEAYVPYPSRSYPPPSGLRPESSGSNRSMPDDIDWYPPPPRNRSASNARYTGYATDYDGTPLLPAAQGRRNVTGPPDVQYSSLRRVPPSSPLAQRPVPAHAASDPSIPKRTRSGLRQEVDGSSSPPSSTSSDDQGVQVDIMPDGAGGSGYTVTRAPVQAPPPVAKNESRKRRGDRR